MDTKTSLPSIPSLGIFGILRESFKTTNRNIKLLTPIFLFVFLSFSLLDFAQNYVLEPIAKDFLYQFAKHPNMFQDFSYKNDQTVLNDLRELLLVKLLIFAVSSVISLVFLVAVVSSASEAYTAKVLSTKDMFLRIRKTWKRPLLTSFYMVLITLGIICVYITSMGIISVVAANSWVYLFSGAICFSILLCYIYVASLWMVSVVVSVLEDGFGGLKAIGRAVELMKGKRLRPSLIMVLFGVGYGVVHSMANLVRSYNLNRSMQPAITIPFTNALICVLKLLMFVAYTVFYHERKTLVDENQVQLGLYVPIAAGEV